MSFRSSGLLVLAAAGIAVLCAEAAVAIPPADKCVAAKTKVAGKYVFCLAKAEAKAIKKGTTADISKCDAKLAQKWAKIETKAAGACPTTGDAPNARNIAVADTRLIASTVAAAPRFQNNGNGTITDTVTGLDWEIKAYLDSSIHDISNTYTWDDASNVHVAALNSGTFGGHDDWRLPSIIELMTLVNLASTQDVAGYPEFDDNCEPLGNPFYTCDVLICSCAFSQVWNGDTFWSSDSNANDPTEAWILTNNPILIEPDARKTFSNAVMAVRGRIEY